MENFEFLLEQPNFLEQLVVVPANDIELSEVQKNIRSDNPQALIIVFKESNCDTDYSFLIRILQAVDLQLDTHCNLYEMNKKEDISLQYSYNNKAVEIVLFFGISPKKAGLQNDWKMYRPYLIGDTYFVYADDLQRIENDANLKKNLWAVLKFVFKK